MSVAPPVLGRDLLRYTVREKRIEPSRLDLRKNEYLGLAASLLDLYRQGWGWTREAIDEALEERTIRARSTRIVRGLGRVLEALSRFESACPEFSAALRQRVYQTSASAWTDGRWNRDRVMAESSRALGTTVGAIEAGLHADLRGADRLEESPALEPVDLLEAYNRALVRGLLVAADRIWIDLGGEEIVVRKPKPGDITELLNRLAGRTDGSIRAEGKWGRRRRLVWEASPAIF